MEIPEETGEQKRLLRSLFNVRVPRKISEDFLKVQDEYLHVLFLELGIGSNTPVIIKYPFWQMTMGNEKATYACLNYKEAYCPREIEDRSVCINSDIDELLDKLA